MQLFKCRSLPMPLLVWYKMLSRCLSVFVLLAWISSTNALVKLVGTPVVYTNNNGGGADEIQAPAGTHSVKYMDAGAAVTAAWWSPMDNIGDLTAIHHIQAQPAGNGVNLLVGGHPGQRNARVRISVYAQVADNFSK